MSRKPFLGYGKLESRYFEQTGRNLDRLEMQFDSLKQEYLKYEAEKDKSPPGVPPLMNDMMTAIRTRDLLALMDLAIKALYQDHLEMREKVSEDQLERHKNFLRDES